MLNLDYNKASTSNSHNMKRIEESELIINEDGSIFHLHLRPEEIADNIILVGDPGRVPMVGEFLSEIEFNHCSREFNSLTGQYKGKRVTVISTGIGTGNCDIVMNELDALANIDFSTRTVKDSPKSLNILRIGTSGAVQGDIPLGSFVFSEMSVGCDSTLRWYKDCRKACVPGLGHAFHKHMIMNWPMGIPYGTAAGEDMNRRFADGCIHGITLSAPGFYGPQGRSLRKDITFPGMADRLESFEFKGLRLTNIEMESSVISGLGHIFGHNCGTICCIIAQRHKKDMNTDYHSRIKDLIQFSLDRLV